MTTTHESQNFKQDAWHHLCDDHRKLDAVLTDVRSLAFSGSFVTGAKRFGEFRIAQERHMTLEDELFTLLRALPGCPDFVHLMSQEHQHAAEIMNDISTFLSRGETDRIGALLAELASRLRDHEKQEQRLFLLEIDPTLKSHPAYELWLRHMLVLQ